MGMSRSDINIVWLDVNLDKWEQDWLLYLLENQYDKFFVTNRFNDLPVDKPTVVVANHAINYRRYLDELRQNNKKYGVVLLSDENLYERMEYLHDPNCVFVARNYFNPEYLKHPKVFTFGLGYKKNFIAKKDSPTFNERGLVWSFAGSFHDDFRKNAVQKFKHLEPNKTHSVSGFNAADGLGTEEYVAMLEDSKFALCPRGQVNNDCFRLYEALEAGSIPVALSFAEHMQVRPSYWHAVFYGESNMPFVVADSWEEAAEKVKGIIEQNRGQEVQAQCQEFWTRWKLNWKAMFEDKIKFLKSV
jgi:hypothetical protein